MRWLLLRLDLDSTAIRPRYDRGTTVGRPIRYDLLWVAALSGLNKHAVREAATISPL